MQRELLKKVMTEEEYLAYEMVSGFRNEYIDGNLIDRSTESPENSEVSKKIALLLSNQVKDQSLYFFTQAIKVKLPGGNYYFYPDLVISREQPSTTKNIIDSPLLVAEILSIENRHFDMFDKFFQYQKIPDLKYCLIIEPIKKIIWLIEKDEIGDWTTEVYDITDGNIYLKFLKMDLNISAVFK